MWRSSSILACAALIGVAACSPTDPTVCTLEARAGITVEIRDARTFAPIAAAATVEIRDGGYVETIGAVTGGGGATDLQKWGAYERAGTYTVTVQRPGYATLTIPGIVVASGVCHVVTVTVQANLTALP